MLKKVKCLSLLVASLWVATGCSSDEPSVSSFNTLKGVTYQVKSTEDRDGEEFIKEGVANLYAKLDAATEIQGDADEIAKCFGLKTQEELTNALLNRSQVENGTKGVFSYFNYEIVRYEYQTIDQNGAQITLSSLLAIPYKHSWSSDLMSPKFINIDCHFTITCDGESPSKSNPVVLPIAADGALVVCPDFVGFGATVSKDQLYLCEEIGARQILDATRAAVKWMKDFGGELDENYYTQVTGYSQGGALAAAVTRAIEKLTPAEKEIFDFKLQSTKCGGGPYNPKATVNWYFDNMDVAYPVAGPLIVKGQIEGNSDLFAGINYDEYFTKEYLESGIEQMYKNPKSYKTSEINEAINKKWGNKRLDNIFNAALFDKNDPNYHRLMDPLYEALERNNLTNGTWVPKTPMWIYHMKDDEVVPFLNCESAKKAWAGGKITVKEDGGFIYDALHLVKDYHTIGGAVFYAEVLHGLFWTIIGNFDI